MYSIEKLKGLFATGKIGRRDFIQGAVALGATLTAATSISSSVMAATPKKTLPDAVINRSKSGFFVPISDWMEGGTYTNSGLRGWASKVYQTQISQ